MVIKASRPSIEQSQRMPYQHHGMIMHRLFFCLALCALGNAQAFDTAPYRIGDILDTTAAQALQARYEARPKQPWREPDEARIPDGAEGAQIRDGIDLMRNTSRPVGK